MATGLQNYTRGLGDHALHIKKSRSRARPPACTCIQGELYRCPTFALSFTFAEQRALRSFSDRGHHRQLGGGTTTGARSVYVVVV